MTTRRYQIARIADIEPIRCPCGQTRRAFTEDPEQIASLHVVEVTDDARTHYHKRLTEIYYILEGAGEMQLDGERYAVQAGDSILIKPDCRHRAIPRPGTTLKVLNVPIPAFDPDDEWFD